MINTININIISIVTTNITTTIHTPPPPPTPPPVPCVKIHREIYRGALRGNCPDLSASPLTSCGITPSGSSVSTVLLPPLRAPSSPRTARAPHALCILSRL
eukprot:5373122-Pyramimonas_sp.AAC.1